MQASAPKWQLVLVLWGTKYPVAEINALIKTVEAKVSHRPRVVLISDRERHGLASHVLTRPFPKFFLRPEFRQSGCQAKLAMFAKGVVPDDLPAVYIDIDTVVLGDVTRFLDLLSTPQTIAILQSVILPFGPLARMIYKVTHGRRYARGNSSIIVFNPHHCSFIAETFERLYSEHDGIGIRPMVADERFISWVAQLRMRAIPKSLAVKFPTEFMWPWRWFIFLRAKFPFLQRRWNNLVAVTLPGEDVKGAELLRLPEGAEIVDRKGRRLIWSDRALGNLRGKIIAYYSELDLHMQQGKEL